MGGKNLTIEEFKQIAIERNGVCLSTTITSSKDKLDFYCNVCNNHFCARADQVKGYKNRPGGWCTFCFKSQPIGIEKVRLLAIEKNGRVLSTKYENKESNLLFHCNMCKHEWEQNTRQLLQGMWCPKCAGKFIDPLDEIRKIAKLKNGKCITKVFKGSKSLIKLKCNICNHTWKSRRHAIINGSWCPKCYGNAKLDLNDAIKEAENKGGKLLSINYENIKAKLLFQCKKLHKPFLMTLGSVKNGHWCPTCNIPLSELICKSYFENIFNYEFISIRPDFLKNPKTKYNLELDGYCKELNIAFEHNGYYHYNSAYRNKKLEDIQYRDTLKIQLCAQNNTKLIIIPELFKQVQIYDLHQFILNECAKQNIDVPNKNEIDININDLIRNY